jgi:hypothetical protein
LKNKDDENRYGSCVKPDLANDSDINELWKVHDSWRKKGKSREMLVIHYRRGYCLAICGRKKKAHCHEEWSALNACLGKRENCSSTCWGSGGYDRRVACIARLLEITQKKPQESEHKADKHSFWQITVLYNYIMNAESVQVEHWGKQISWDHALYEVGWPSVSQSVVRGPVPVLGKIMPILRKYESNRMIILISRNNHERGKTLLDVACAS